MAGDVNLILDSGEIALALRDPVTRDLFRRATAVANRAKILCPVDRGQLRQSITVALGTAGLGSDPVAVIGSRLEYAIYVHEGTGIYGSGSMIRPKSGKFLVWEARGTTSRRKSRVPGRGFTTTRAQVGSPLIFARQVRGMPGRPFLRDALPAALT